VTLSPGETLAAGPGHAEADIASYARQNGLRLIEVGATRPICTTCAGAIEGAGATAVTPLKEVP
jgi:filamentous hemagglutinin